MSDIQGESDQEIIDKLTDHPGNDQLIQTAKEIADIVYGVRCNHVFDGITESEDIEIPLSNTLNELFATFRQLALSIIETSLPEDDHKLYIRIIHPLIAQQLDSAG